MATTGFHVFCGGVLWNDTLLLDNTWPQFTDCFMHTVLIWVPCGFLFLMLPLYVTSVNKQEEERRTFPVTVVNGARLFCCITLATLTLVQLLVRTDEESISMSMAAYLGDALRLAAYILLALMTQYERVKGAQSTAVPFFFWLLTAGCNLIPFYTIIIEQQYTRDLVSFSIFTLSYTLQLASLGLTACLNHGHRTKYISQTPCPETTCSYPAYLLFWWMTRLMVTGYRRDMEEADLWLLPPSDQIGHLVPTFEQLWAQEQRRCDRANSKRQPVRLISAKFSGATEKTQLLHKTTAKHEEEDQKKASPSLLRVLVKMHMKDIAICHMQKILSDLILLCSPLLLGVLMTFLQERPRGREWQAYVLCVAMFCTIIFKSIFFAHSMFLSTRIGLRIKSTLIAAIYQKALTMNNAAKTKSTVGEIVNMMSVDAQRILDMMGMLFFAITTPVQFIWSIALIYVYVGPSVLVGACVLLLLIPISVYVVSKQQTLQTENLKYKDIRIRLYSEILNGIKVLKLYAWEPSFREKIREVRLKEVALLLKAAMLSSVLSLSWELAPYLVTLAIFATYVLSNPNGYLDAGTAFVSLSVLNLVRAPLSLLSTMIMYLTQAYVSIKRINEFLKNDDLDPTAVTHDDSAAR